MQNFVGKTKCIAGYMKVANTQGINPHKVTLLRHDVYHAPSSNRSPVRTLSHCPIHKEPFSRTLWIYGPRSGFNKQAISTQNNAWHLPSKDAYTSLCRKRNCGSRHSWRCIGLLHFHGERTIRGNYDPVLALPFTSFDYIPLSI